MENAPNRLHINLNKFIEFRLHTVYKLINYTLQVNQIVFCTNVIDVIYYKLI